MKWPARVMTSSILPACFSKFARHSYRSHDDRDIYLSRYLQGPGTGMTNLPSFSAIKFSVVFVELPFSSFFSITITSFFVGLRLRQTFPPLGESCGAVAFFTSAGSDPPARSWKLCRPLHPTASFCKSQRSSGRRRSYKGPIATSRCHWPQARFCISRRTLSLVPRWRHVQKAPE